MSILSAILYFLAQHPFWAWPVLIAVGVLLGHAMAKWRGREIWYLLILPFFLCGPVNIFTAHISNALFLNAFGVNGTAVITHSEETSSTLNDQNIWAYDAVLKTSDDKDVLTQFDSMSASIYPIRNEILIPPDGQPFAVKYIPGFARNFVILSDQSPYGKKYLISQDRAPVDKAAAQFAVSPNNKAFIAEYRDALRTFLANHSHNADPDLVADYHAKLAGLPPHNANTQMSVPVMPK
jgi:hypothetical protein